MSTILRLWKNGARSPVLPKSFATGRTIAPMLILIPLNLVLVGPSPADDSIPTTTTSPSSAGAPPQSTPSSKPVGTNAAASSGSSATCMTAEDTDPSTTPPSTGGPLPLAPVTIEQPTMFQPATVKTPAPVAAAKPNPSGKQQIALQLPPYGHLQRYIRMRQYAAIDRIKSLAARVRAKLTACGMDPNIDFDTAAKNGSPVLSIYIKPLAYGNNMLAKGFKVEVSICRYVRKPSGRVDLVGFRKIGETGDIYSPADFENKAAGLVDLYLTTRADEIRAAKKVKPSAPKKKTR
ncbi:MAG: hypothetical protein K2X93_09685 [Candidatus Obscuribacterales bacterium]|nr:hypothetical protein [Candidatus Obscuribacterales bacterium]